MTAKPELAPAIIDISRASLWCELASEAWPRALGAGGALAAAVAAIRLRSDDFDVALERQIGEFVAGHLDATMFAAVRSERATFVGTFADMMLGQGYLARQLVQDAPEDVLASWDWATGVSLNARNIVDEGDQTSTPNLSRGWLSARQRQPQSADEVHSTMVNWALGHLHTFRTIQLRTPGAFGVTAQEEWASVLESLDEIRTHPRSEWLPRASTIGCVTPLAAEIASRDIVYLIASPFGGLAVRYYGGLRYREQPAFAELPKADTSFVRDLHLRVRTITEGPKGPDATRDELDAIRSELGSSVFRPLLETWPDLQVVAMVPISEMQGLPIFSATIGPRDELWSRGIDVTVVPSAASLYTASTPRGKVPAERAMIMGDSADGPAYLPWVPIEVDRVAAIYGKERDFLQCWPGAADTVERIRPRSLETAQPAVAAREHVLSRLEDAQTVHLACHGIVPMDSGKPTLYLGGEISFDVLFQHRFAAGSCIVLSACSVGRSLEGATLARFGFPAMLLATGARAVIASLWPIVDCEATVDFMTELHRNLSGGLAPSAALSRAAHALSTSGVPPAIWAGFEVYGS